MTDNNQFDNIFDALDRDEETHTITPLEQLIPREIMITDRCLQLGYAIGPLVQMLDHRPLEVGGFFVGELNGVTPVLRDFIVPDGLPISDGFIVVGEHYPQTVEELTKRNTEQGTTYKTLAMFHIHPAPGGIGLAHSGMDDEVLTNLVNKMAETTRRTYTVPYALIDARIRREYSEEGVVLKGDALTDVIVKHLFPDNEKFFSVLQAFGFKPNKKSFKPHDFLAQLLEIIDLKTEEPRIINYALSFVFNNGGKGPYVKMGIEERFVLSQQKATYDTTDTIPLKIIEVGENLVSEEDITDLIIKRVVFPPKQKSYTTAVAGAVTQMFTSSVQAVSNAVFRGKIFGDDLDIHPQDRTDQDEGIVLRRYGLPQPKRKIVVRKGKGKEHKEEQYSGSAYSKRFTPVAKTQDDMYTLDEAVQLFTLAAYMYVAEYRHAPCKYSKAMHTLLELTASYKQDEKMGLRTAVLLTDQLEEDSLEAVLKPDQEAYKMRSMQENMLAEVRGKQYCEGDDMYDVLSVQFMLSFMRVDTERKNELLEEYFTTVHEKGLPPAQLSSQSPYKLSRATSTSGTFADEFSNINDDDETW